MNSAGNKVRTAYRFNGIAGCVRRAISRKSHVMLAVYNNEQAGYGSFGWTVKCETHRTSIETDSLADANRKQADPGGWCEQCAEIGGE